MFLKDYENNNDLGSGTVCCNNQQFNDVNNGKDASRDVCKAYLLNLASELYSNKAVMKMPFNDSKPKFVKGERPMMPNNNKAQNRSKSKPPVTV